MSFTNPYRQHNYVGEYASDALATAGVVALGWDVAGSPQAGMIYYQTANTELRYWDGSAWTAFGGSGGSISLPNINQVLFVDKASPAPGAPDGTMQAPFVSINAALTAANVLTPSATNRIGVIVYPGVYAEALVTLDPYVDLIAFDKATTIVAPATVAVPLTLNHANIEIRNFTFECISGNTEKIVTDVPAVAGTVVFKDCDFLGTNGSANNYVEPRFNDYEWHRCRFTHDDTANIIIYDWTNSERTGKFFDCEIRGVLASDSYMHIEAHDTHFFSTTTNASWWGSLRLWSSGLRRRFYNCRFENTAALGFPVYSNIAGDDAADFFGCRFESAGVNDIKGGNVGAMGFYGCQMSKGISTLVRTKMTIKYTNGQPGDYDYYTTIEDAIGALSTADDGCTIYMLGDFSSASQVQLPAFSMRCTIDGMGHTWTDTGPTSGFTLIAGAGTTIVRSVEFVGATVACQGAGTKLVVESCHIEGQVYMRGVGDDVSTLAVIHDSTIIGVTGVTSALSINSALPTVIVSQSYLKGFTGALAVDYGGNDNDNVKFEYSKVFHGDLGSNNPFGGVSSGQVDYAAHHCVFNEEPDIASPTYYNNTIDLAQRHNTIDADGDYHWRNW